MALQVPPNCDLTLGLRCVDKTVPGATVWEMRADERFANPAGIIQGGFLAAMLDSSMGASAVTALRGRKANVANAEMKVSYLRPAKVGGVLRCETNTTHAGSTVLFLEGRVIDENGHVVASATSSYIARDRA
ncbi:MAG: PaaI family thioesterase [Actinobacteria bacterium]|jgi:uncharacterized protein (TIGR00369 family)|nr:PaaI family thioesterase [Actinomycetota bacterium]